MRGLALAFVMAPLAVAPAYGASLATETDEPLPDLERATFRHGVSYFGDFKYPRGFRHFDYANPDAPKGGSLARSTAANFNSFTPLLNKGVGQPGGGVISEHFLYDSLFWPSDDEVGVYYGSLAREIAHADDYRWAFIRLRDEARWHDGVPVTARDIQYTFEHIFDYSWPGVKVAFRAIEAIEIVSEKEVLFRFADGVNANTLIALAKVPIMPAHWWKDRDASKTTLEVPLGSGPYRLASFEQRRHVTYERVPDYWGRDLGVHRGRHNFDTVRFDYYRDATVAREAFRKGLLDIRDEDSARFWRTGYDIPAREKGLLKLEHQRYQLYIGLTNSIGFNTRRERFQDPRVREALTLAFDYEWYNRVLNFDFFERPMSFFGKTYLAAVGVPSARELQLLEPFRDELPPRLFTEPFSYRTSTGAGRDREALARALQLFREAGWDVVDGVMRNAAGEPFELEFLIQNASTQQILLSYIDQLKRLGVDARIRLVEPAQNANLRRDFRYDAAFRGFPISFPPSRELVAYFASYGGAYANIAGIRSKAVDALVLAALKAQTRDELIAATRALDRVLLWSYYLIPIQQIVGPRRVFWDKFGRSEIEAPYRTSFPGAWWEDPVKAARVSEALGQGQ